MRISDVLAAMAEDRDGVRLDAQPQLADIFAALGPRSFGIVLVLFGLPNLLPVPGLPMVCGVVIGVVAFQMLRGDEALSLPGWLARRRLKREDFARVIHRARPTLRAIEKVMRPRMTMLTAPLGQRVIGGVLLALAIALMAPIPFFGGIPPGIAVILFGFALAERDGIFVLLGALATIFAIAFTGALTWAVLKGVVYLFT